MLGRAVGIDLGTTYSAVAVVDEFGKPVMLKNADGQTTTPSVVFFDPPCYTVGATALQATVTDPDRVVQFVKRIMGEADRSVDIKGEKYSPEFVSAMILKKIVGDASEALGEPINKAVITVPAYFTEVQRHATLDAGRMAGLEVTRLIAEPTAAALSYGISRKIRNRRVLVYDLGGGTFDVTILDAGENDLTVRAVGGDHKLGGKDFDDAIVEYIRQHIIKEHGYDITTDKELNGELHLKAEAAKRQLSGRHSVPLTFKVPSPLADGTVAGRSVPVKIELTREIFAQIATPLLDRTELHLEALLLKAGLAWGDIDDLLCVGGSSRMPVVSEMLERISGRTPLLHDPDECVAKGAALQAALMEKHESLPSVAVAHVLSHSLGVAVMSEGRPMIDHVIPALTRLPATQSRDGYTTTTDRQTTVQIQIYEGESTLLESYGKGPVGVFNLDTQPPRPKGQPKITVEFLCDEDGKVTATARDTDTGRESSQTISLHSQRTVDEISREDLLMQAAIVA